jgi:hypothetical protein
MRDDGQWNIYLKVTASLNPFGKKVEKFSVDARKLNYVLPESSDNRSHF